MNLKEESGNYVQCQSCGRIYQIARKLSIEISIVNCRCPRCGSYDGLNCGNIKEDIYIYMNPNVDERYFY